VADDEDLPAVVAEWEPSSALRAGSTGLDDLHHIVSNAPRWLADDGALVLEMAPDQTDTVAGWAEQAGMPATVHPDLSGRSRAVIARKNPE
jgi:release factor glutamine methyltransferase